MRSLPPGQCFVINGMDESNWWLTECFAGQGDEALRGRIGVQRDLKG